MIHFAGLLLGLTVSTLTVLSDDSQPLSGARVTFFDARGGSDVQISGTRGIAKARAGFEPVSIEISATGYETLRLQHPGARSVVLHPALRLIGQVSIATGSALAQHRIPMPTSLLSRNIIALSSALQSDALLRSLPGFDRNRSNSAFTNYGQLRVGFSGAGNDRGLVLADDVPAQDGFGGQIDWAAYPVEDVERVEMVRAASSALYGTGAIGGVLDLRTWEARRPQGEGTVSATIGTASERALNLRAGRALGKGLVGSLYANDQSSSYFDLPADYSSAIDVPASARSSVLRPKLAYRTPNASLTASGLLATDARSEGRPNYRFGRALEQYDISYSHSSPRAVLGAGLYARDATIANLADRFPSAPGIARYVQHVTTSERGAFAKWRVMGAQSEFELRADDRQVYGVSDQSGFSRALQAYGSGTQRLDGLALESVLHGTKAMLLSGLRYDVVAYPRRQTQTGGASPHRFPPSALSVLSPRIALRFDLSAATAVRASLASGFRAPYLNELLRGFAIGGTTYQANPDLGPERSFDESVGVDILSRRTHVGLDFARAGIRDAIAFVTKSPALQVRSNIPQVRTESVTLSGDRKLGNCTTATFSFSNQYSRVVAGPAALSGKRLPFVPDKSASLQIFSQHGRVRAGVNAAYLGETYADDLNTQSLGAPIVVGFNAVLRLENGADLRLLADNLSGQTYRTSVDRLAQPPSFDLRLELPLGRTGAPEPSLCGE